MSLLDVRHPAQRKQTFAFRANLIVPGKSYVKYFPGQLSQVSIKNGFVGPGSI